MTTVAQVKEAVQPLLQRNSDLALVGRLVIVKPVHHILRAISIGRSMARELFVPSWAVGFLSWPGPGLSLNWGERVYGPGAWDISEYKNLPELLCQAIEEQALPLLRPIQSIDDLVGFASKERFPLTYLDLYPHQKIFFDVARGRLDDAWTICEYMASDAAKQYYLPSMQEEYDCITKELCPLITKGDRPGLANILHRCEEASVRIEKLEKLWERTPFPIEL
jgi:hypothetical protein